MSLMRNKNPLVLILCGGRSLRLWPLTQYKSKNFLDIFGFSPLELTIKRFLKLTPRENIFLVANKNEKKELNRLKLIKKTNIIFEPASRNTAAAILLALLKLEKYSSKNIIISPVDHLINKENEFYKALRQALSAAERGFICTLGVKPKEPTPNFGYIQVNPVRELRSFTPLENSFSNGVKPGKNRIYSIRRFIEKPNPKRAKKLIASGNCFYNSGIFIATLRILIGEYKKYYSDYSFFVNSFKKNKVVALYRQIKNIPFDQAIMEQTKKGTLVKAGFSWKDFGSWNTVYQVLPKDKYANAVRVGTAQCAVPTFLPQSRNNLIYLDNPKKKILAMGLENVFFVDTEGFSLLANRSQIDNLKKYLEQFKPC